MSVQFASASSQGLKNATSPVTAPPFTVAIWSKQPPSGVFKVICSFVDTAGTSNGFVLLKGDTDKINCACYSGSGFDETASATTVTDSWTFTVWRVISAANRRWSTLHPNGTIDNTQSTVSITPASIDAIGLGYQAYGTPDGYMDGSIAEFALWNADVQGDGTQLLDSTLRQMAYSGPFSLPHMLGNLVDYQSFKTGLTSDRARADEVFNGAGFNRQVWTAVNAPTLGPHVQLPATYMKPPGLVPRALVL